MPTNIITDQPIEHVYTAIAGQTEFDFTFQIFNGAADLYVEVDDVEVGAFTYTLSSDGDTPEGGYITLDDECAGGETVIIRRVLAVERVTQFPNTGPVSMPTVNHELNRIVGLTQQISKEVDDLSEEIGYSDERARDALAAALTGGTNITINVDDGNDLITVDCDISDEYVRDLVGETIIAGAGIELTVDDVANTITVAQTFGEGGTMTAEDARDIIGTALTAGPGIAITVDDLANTITIENTSGAYTAENARDDVGAALVEGTGIDITIDDAGNTITLAQVTSKTLSFFIPAGAMKPRATNGPLPSSIETTTNDNNFDTLDYDQSTQESAHFIFRMPKQVDEAGNFTAAFGWTSSIASGNVRWGLSYLVLRDNVVLDTAGTAAVQVTDTHNGVGKLNVTARTGNFAISGLQAEDLVLFGVYRDAANGADDLAGDAQLLWLDLKVPIAGFDDA